MATRQQRQAGLFLIAVGAVLLWLAFSTLEVSITGTLKAGRAGILDYDGQNDDFTLKIEDISDSLESDSTWSAVVTVTNNGNRDGTMYVQGSILDQNEHSFLSSVRTQRTVSETTGSSASTTDVSNCAYNEPETDTEKVTLEQGASVRVTLSGEVPIYDSSADYVFYAAAFEQCWTPSDDPFISDQVKTSVEVTAEDDSCRSDSDCGTDEICTSRSCVSEECSADADCSEIEHCYSGRCIDEFHDECDNDQDCAYGYICDIDYECSLPEDAISIQTSNTSCDSYTDCSGWFKFWDKEAVTCESGLCTYTTLEAAPVNLFNLENSEADIPSGFDDSALKSWAREHVIFLWIAGFLVLIIGWNIAYSGRRRVTY